jgi:3-methyladenine DNA glycosylase AlkD
MSLLIEIKEVFTKNSNESIALQQAAYMKNNFEFFGLKSPIRKALQRPFLIKKNLPSKEVAFQLVQDLWNEPQRELHYFAMELLFKYNNEYEKEDVKFFEKLISENSWWDSIDFISPNILGVYFKKFPEMRKETVERWLKSENFWLQRSTLLFQLKYKEELDTELLTYVIDRLKHEKEFFIRKAIGWILREYSKVNPGWVTKYVEQTTLQPLSRKEALKVVERNQK